MNFNDTPEEAKFRKEASDWLSANATLKDDEEAGNSQAWEKTMP